MYKKNIPVEILSHIFSYIDQNALSNIKSVSRKFYYISTREIREKNHVLIKKPVFKRHREKLYWLNDRNYKIHDILNTCIKKRKITIEFFDLAMYYLETRYLNDIRASMEEIERCCENIYLYSSSLYTRRHA